MHHGSGIVGADTSDHLMVMGAEEGRGGEGRVKFMNVMAHME
jgi:hypothetical protein